MYAITGKNDDALVKRKKKQFSSPCSCHSFFCFFFCVLSLQFINILFELCVFISFFFILIPRSCCCYCDTYHIWNFVVAQKFLLNCWLARYSILCYSFYLFFFCVSCEFFFSFCYAIVHDVFILIEPLWVI